MPQADRESGRSQEGYECNLELVGAYQHGEGASWQFAWYDDCAYYGTLARRLQAVCDRLEPHQIVSFFERWLRAIPTPLTKTDRAAGYWWELSMRQIGSPARWCSTRPAGPVRSSSRWSPTTSTWAAPMWSS